MIHWAEEEELYNHVERVFRNLNIVDCERPIGDNTFTGSFSLRTEFPNGSSIGNFYYYFNNRGNIEVGYYRYYHRRTIKWYSRLAQL